MYFLLFSWNKRYAGDNRRLRPRAVVYNLLMAEYQSPFFTAWRVAVVCWCSPVRMLVLFWCLGFVVGTDRCDVSCALGFLFVGTDQCDVGCALGLYIRKNHSNITLESGYCYNNNWRWDSSESKHCSFALGSNRRNELPWCRSFCLLMELSVGVPLLLKADVEESWCFC